MRRLAEGAQEGPAHALRIAEPDGLGDAVDGLARGLDSQARRLQPQPLHRLGGCQAGLGAEGQRGPTLADAALSAGPLRFTGQSLAVYAATASFIIALWLFFGLSLYGKALRATAVNRIGARLSGIRTSLSGQIAFLLQVGGESPTTHIVLATPRRTPRRSV